MKFKKLLIIGFLFFIVVQLQAQTYVFKFRPLNKKLWGFATIDGKTIIEPQFPYSDDFSDCGIALVVKEEFADFVKCNGQIIQTEPEEFTLKNAMGEFYQGYQNGFVSVEYRRKWGYLNSRGKLSIPFKYDEVSVFNENYAVVRLKKNFFILDTNGVETPVKIENVVTCRSFSEGLARFSIKDSCFGFINYFGDIVINAKYLGCGYFKSGLAWARITGGKIGFIDRKGNWKIEPQFEMAYDFDKESGMAQVKKDEKWMYVDSTGKTLNVSISERLVSFSDGFARGFKNGLVGFFNNEGNWVIEPIYENAKDFENGYAAVKYNGKWGFIDKTGKWAIEPSYAHVGDVIKVK